MIKNSVVLFNFFRLTISKGQNDCCGKNQRSQAGKDVRKFSHKPLLDVLDSITCIWNALGYHRSGTFYKDLKITNVVPYVCISNENFKFEAFRGIEMCST